MLEPFFLHRELEEEIFITQLKGFSVIRKEKLVCWLRKSLHRLKQAPIKLS